MSSTAHRGPEQATPSQEGAFQQPQRCPFPVCAAVERGQNELERLNRTEAQLREALAREQMLLIQKDELIRHKDLMHRESDHRLMNGLQMVSSLLSLQSREAQNDKLAEELRVAANRVATIGRVHQRLHALDHVGSVELKQYLGNLCHDMSGILFVKVAQHNLSVEGIVLEVPTKIGIPLGYVVSELVMNCAKYADGKITVSLAVNPGNGYELSVSDDGPGFPDGFDPKKSKGLGMKIVSSLVNQIGGQLLFGPAHSGEARDSRSCSWLVSVLLALWRKPSRPPGWKLNCSPTTVGEIGAKGSGHGGGLGTAGFSGGRPGCLARRQAGRSLVHGVPRHRTQPEHGHR
jgi:two-component system, sensor histidine kinase PdtaS